MDRQFFETLFNGSDGFIAASFMKGPKDNKKIVNKFFPTKDLDSLEDNCKRAEASEFDCYFVPTLLAAPTRKKAAFKASRVVWIDHDNAESGLPNFHELEPTYVVETSPGKHHVYWLLDSDLLDGQKLEGINRSLAEAFGGDLSGWDRTQLLRVPGMVNYGHGKNYGPHTTVVTESAVRYNTGVFPLALGNLRLRLSL